MSQAALDFGIEVETAKPRQKDIYIIGGITATTVAVLITFAIIAFFIWPYKPGFASAQSIFETLQKDRLGGLIALDLPMLVITPLNLLLYLAMYMALKRVNATYALIALILSLMAVVLLIPTRPLVELVTLSNSYAVATTQAARSQYLAAGEALLALFGGTAWMMASFFFPLAGLINSLLMLRTPLFHKATAYVGLGVCLVGLGFFLPAVGVGLLFLNTVGSVVWLGLMARDFFRLGRQS